MNAKELTWALHLSVLAMSLLSFGTVLLVERRTSTADSDYGRYDHILNVLFPLGAFCFSLAIVFLVAVLLCG